MPKNNQLPQHYHHKASHLSLLICDYQNYECLAQNYACQSTDVAFPCSSSSNSLSLTCVPSSLESLPMPQLSLSMHSSLLSSSNSDDNSSSSKSKGRNFEEVRLAVGSFGRESGGSSGDKAVATYVIFWLRILLLHVIRDVDGWGSSTLSSSLESFAISIRFTTRFFFTQDIQGCAYTQIQKCSIVCFPPSYPEGNCFD